MAISKKTLEIGSKAPSFSLHSDDGEKISLEDFAGRLLVLYFYPKDDTAGCTREAIDFSKGRKVFEKAGATIVGVSKDSVDRHAKFKAKHDLLVTLASDETGKTIEKYGSWIEKTLYGRKYMGIDRSTFLIDGKGIIRRIWRKVRVPGHVDEVLSVVKELGKVK